MVKKKKQSRRSHYSSEQIKKNQNKLFKSGTVSAGEQHNTSVRNKNLKKDSTPKVSLYTKQGKKRTPAQLKAAQRIAEKKAGTYKKPMSIKEKVKNKLKIKKKK